MFYYISFLRPPPSQAATYGALSITPQISNDLRTEPFEGSQEIFYSWTVYPAPNAHHTATAITTKPVKLTTYRSATAYKEIPVQIPPGIRDGQRARLTLMGNAQAAGRTRPDCIDLSEDDIGKIPFPVSSTPILFSGRGAKGAPKQEMIERTYLTPWTLPSEGGSSDDKGVMAPLKFMESTSFDLDKKIWDSGIGLTAWLVQYKENPALGEGNSSLSALHDVLFSSSPINALELGTGIGIVSVGIASLRTGIMRKEVDGTLDKIFSTDVGSAIPLLEQNIRANTRICGSCIPEALVLDWEDDDLPYEVKNLGTIDLIMMADVSYNTASFPALAKTLSKLVHLTRENSARSKTGRKSPVILLGYKERDPAERTFWDMAEEVGICFEKVGEKHGAGGQPVEIWVGKVKGADSS
ncbi:putative methyltransferase-domain-containing protein [Panaeolus papilionaceus]|nr:putative methyltransferase-domain-containing protein [Panaeolus papilionaceus]